MNRRGVALIFALLVIIVLLILLSSFFLKSINENNLVRRYVNSTRALWLAEAGVAQAIKNLPATTTTPIDEALGDNSNHRYIYTTVWFSSPQAGVDIYQINSTGRVILSSGNFIDRNIEVFVSYAPPNPGNFNAAIEVQGDLRIAGNPTIVGSVLPNSNFTFEGKFNLTPEEVKEIARIEGHYYEDPSSPLADYPEGASQDPYPKQITWVRITEPNHQLKIPRTGWEGGGILVVEGETDIEGGIFYGIIWVIGELRISGNPQITGSVVAESGAEITTDVTGTPILTHDETQIQNALNLLITYARKTILSWHEY